MIKKEGASTYFSECSVWILSLWPSYNNTTLHHFIPFHQNTHSNSTPGLFLLCLYNVTLLRRKKPAPIFHRVLNVGYSQCGLTATRKPCITSYHSIRELILTPNIVCSYFVSLTKHGLEGRSQYLYFVECSVWGTLSVT